MPEWRDQEDGWWIKAERDVDERKGWVRRIRTLVRQRNERMDVSLYGLCVLGKIVPKPALARDISESIQSLDRLKHEIRMRGQK